MPKFCYESGWVQSSSVPIAYRAYYLLGNAYSDTAAVTSCNRRSQYMKSWIATNWIQFSIVPAILHLQH